MENQNVKNEVDLLPCPFCGSTNLYYDFTCSQGFIRCGECECTGPCDDEAADPICSVDAAYATWNRRILKPVAPAKKINNELAGMIVGALIGLAGIFAGAYFMMVWR